MQWGACDFLFLYEQQIFALFAGWKTWKAKFSVCQPQMSLQRTNIIYLSLLRWWKIHNEEYLVITHSWITLKPNTVKKRLSIFPFPAGMSLTKLSLTGKNKIIPGQGEFGQWHPGLGRENRESFLQCRGLSTIIIQFVILLWRGLIHVKILKWHVKKIRHFTFTRQRWSSTTFNSLLAFDIKYTFTPLSSYLFSLRQQLIYCILFILTSVCLSACQSGHHNPRCLPIHRATCQPFSTS